MAKSETTTSARHLEVLGLCCLAGAAFTAAALLSYTPEDPSLNHSQPEMALNWMGPVGAHLAASLMEFLGLAAGWIPILLVALAWPLLRARTNWPAAIPWLLTGWTAMVLASSGALAFWSPSVTPLGAPLTPPCGGLVGLALAHFLTAWIGLGGFVLVLLVLFVAGLMAATPFSLMRTFEFLLEHRPWAVMFGFRHPRTSPILGKGPKANEKQATDLLFNLPHIAEPLRESFALPLTDEGEKAQGFHVTPVTGEFHLPPLGLLDDLPPEEARTPRDVYISNAQALEQRLLDFGVAGKVVEICPGPVVTMYEFSPAPGIKINKVTSLADDLALALKSASVRIVAPIPGKAVIGIELANAQRQTVSLKEILASDVFQARKGKLPLALGQDIVGQPVVTDLARMPHLLIAGATGTGKSVGLNAMICSLLYRHNPDRLRLLMIDPKRIELSLYDGIPHLLHPVVSEPKEATRALRWAVMEMERRYELLEKARARNLEGYNRGAEEHLPYLVIIIDELADLMMVSSKDVEAFITRLAQMARAAGIHLLVATQRPSVDVLTGLIKANFPARISFKVSSKVDSRTILDVMGAERLLGMGDMLFLPPGTASLQRIHGSYVSEAEIGKIVEFLKGQREPQYDLTVIEPIPGEEADGEKGPGGEGDLDEKYDEAVEIVTQTGQASISMLQRRLRVGYNRAARMIEQMEREGVVSPTDGMGRRSVLVRGYDQ